MLYMVTARFKPGMEAQHAALAQQFGDHLGQPLLHIRLVGALKDEHGKHTGVHMLMEANSRRQVDDFLDQSPYKLAGLYKRVEVDEIEIEAGGLN